MVICMGKVIGGQSRWGDIEEMGMTWWEEGYGCLRLTENGSRCDGGREFILEGS